jgi:hypothetical protein
MPEETPKRLSKAVREHHAAQYLIATLCVWDVEQRWHLDWELMEAWDRGRFDDPYRQVLLPRYPPIRQGVLLALGRQWGVLPETLDAHVATGRVFPDYATRWDVAMASLQKLTTLVRWEHAYGTRIWRVAEGTLDLHQAYREQTTDSHNRSSAQREALKTLNAIARDLHPDDLADWMVSQCAIAWPGRVLDIEDLPFVRRYRFLRDLWQRLLHGEEERAAFLRFLEAEAPLRARMAETWDLLRRGHPAQQDAQTPACLRALGLTWPCTMADVTRAYRTLAKVVHPDVGGSTADFQALHEAYGTALAWVTQQTDAKTAPVR